MEFRDLSKNLLEFNVYFGRYRFTQKFGKLGKYVNRLSRSPLYLHCAIGAKRQSESVVLSLRFQRHPVHGKKTLHKI